MQSRLSILLGLLLVEASCADEAEKPPTPAARAQAPSEPATPSPDPSEPAPWAAEAAEAAYRAAIDAYNTRSADAYREAFADPLRCFYTKVDHPPDALWQARKSAFEDGASAQLFIAELTPLRVAEDEVVFLDRGAWWLLRSEAEAATTKRPYMSSSSDPIAQGVHAKIISMRTIEGTWRIEAETGPKTIACIGDVEMPELPAAHRSCAEQNKACLKECDRVCDDCGACNGCNMCPGACLTELGACVGAPQDWGLGI